MTRVVLAIDTATPAVTAGVVSDGNLLAERVSVDARGHAERITPNVLAALADAGLRMADLDAVVGTAKRMAMNRMKPTDQSLPPLIWSDFEQALARNHAS